MRLETPAECRLMAARTDGVPVIAVRFLLWAREDLLWQLRERFPWKMEIVSDNEANTWWDEAAETRKTEEWIRAWRIRHPCPFGLVQ